MTESLTLSPANRSTVLRFWMLLLCVILLVALAPGARGDTTYNYTGQSFNFSVNSGPAGATNLTVSFTLASPLGDNLSGLIFTPATFSFNDGAATDTIDQSNVTGFFFQVSTDSSGNITSWNITANSTIPAGAGTFTNAMGTANPCISVGVLQLPPQIPCVNDFSFGGFGSFLSGSSFSLSDASIVDPAITGSGPGTWSMSSSTGGGGGGTGVPEPSSVLLLTSGLASLGFLRRRFLPA